MFIKLNERRAQNTAEYAIVIGLVVAAIIGIGPLMKRLWQGKVRDFTDVYVACGEGSVIPPSVQYEYDSLFSDFQTNKTAALKEELTDRQVHREDIDEWTNRIGYEKYKYTGD